MTTKRNVVLPAVFVILKHDNKILLQRRFNTGWQDGNYTFISGHVDANEAPLHTACREAKEEAGIVLKPEDIHFEQVLYRRGFHITKPEFDPTQTERVDFFLSATRWEGEPYITEPNKCDDLRWFSLDSLPKNIIPIVKTFLEQYPNPPPYFESGYK